MGCVWLGSIALRDRLGHFWLIKMLGYRAHASTLSANMRKQ